jgi:hypothetical protein
MGAPGRKVRVPLAASTYLAPDGPDSRTKTIKITGIPGIPVLELKSKRKLELEIWNGPVLLGYLHLGSISYWKNPGEVGKGKKIHWEQFKGWVDASHLNRKPS